MQIDKYIQFLELVTKDLEDAEKCRSMESVRHLRQIQADLVRFIRIHGQDLNLVFSL
jgi:hypothetical protein